MSVEDQIDPTPSEVMEELLLAAGAEIRAGIPGIVTKVESTDPPRVTVAPLVRRAGAAAADPGIPGVPVQFPRSGGAVLSMPVAVGNPGWLKFSDREIDGWIAGGGSKAVTAVDPRTHDLADCVFEPFDIGRLPAGAAGNLWLGHTGTSILEGAAVKLGALAAQAVMRGDLFNAAHRIMLTAVAAAFASGAAAFTAAAAYYTPAAAAWGTTGIPPGTGSGLADHTALGAPTMLLCNTVRPTATAAATACTAAAGLMTAAATAITTVFLPAQVTWLSTKVKVE